MTDPTLLQYIRLLEANTESIKDTLVRMEEKLERKASQAEHDALEVRVSSTETGLAGIKGKIAVVSAGIGSAVTLFGAWLTGKT